MDSYIDNYCERLEPGLWAEPLNAVTNMAFFLAAYFALALASDENAINRKTLILIELIAIIGIGSALFHTFATKLTLLSDVIPILVFQIAFIWFYALSVIKLSVVKTAGLFGVFMALTVAAENAPAHILNGSLGYAPAILFLFGFGVWHWRAKMRERYVLLIASVVFMVSLTFRSIDMAVCHTLPMGTHFMWHILNGCVLYLAARGFIKNQSSP